MKKIISSLTIKNWNKEATRILTLYAGAIGMIAVWSDDFLKLLHEAPFPVSHEIDIWVKWLLKIAASLLAIFTLLSKRKNDIDIGINIKNQPAKPVSNDNAAG